jgi:hypothetical protein
MKASTTALVAVLTIGSLGLVAGSASACGGGYGGSYNNYHKVYVKKVYVQPIVVEPCYYPNHCFAIVCPGDTWFTLSLKEYGKPHLWKKIAIFNGLPLNAGLIPGMQLRLPEIHPDGALLPSSAPAPIALAARAPVGLPQAGFAAPQANFIPQGGSPAGLPQGANFAAPQGQPTNGASMNAPSFNGAANGAPSMNAPTFGGAANGAANFAAPNGAPSTFQGNGPIMPNSMPTMTQPKIEAPTVDVAPKANIRTVSTEERLPSVAIGSVLTLDGQSLGDDRGTVRLVVNGLTLPIEVLEWNASVVKVQLPQLELAGALKAEIEVVRADGSLASKSAVELTPATNRLALGN